jgi:hypothetical protein
MITVSKMFGFKVNIRYLCFARKLCHVVIIFVKKTTMKINNNFQNCFFV